MAATVTSQIRVLLTSTLSNTLGIAVGAAAIDKAFVQALTSGTGANQADRVFSEQRTLAASANVDLDLAGVLTDAFGVALTFVKVKAIAVFAAAGNTNNVVVGGAASNQFIGPFGAGAHTISVAPGGAALLVAPGAAGWAVTAGTGDLLRMTNGGAGTSVTYDLVLLGTSA